MLHLFCGVQVTVDLMHKADEYFQNQGGTKVRPTATSTPSNCKKPVMTYGLIRSVVALIYKIDGVIQRVATAQFHMMVVGFKHFAATKILIS